MIPTRRHPLSEFVSPLDRATCVTATERLCDALTDILELPFVPPAFVAADWWTIEHRLTELIVVALGSDTDRPAVVALVQTLTRPQAPSIGESVRALVRDTGEILFLPRQQREEYRLNRTGAPPYRIAKLLLEYALFSRRLDGLMAALNKRFCVACCPDPPVGCCHLLGYDLGLVPEGMLAAQAVEARRRGWRCPPHPDLRKCRYHTDTGCALRLFKSPACIGAMCRAVEQHLDARFAPAPLDRFRQAMTVFRNCDLDRERVFNAMHALLEAGSALIDDTGI